MLIGHFIASGWLCASIASLHLNNANFHYKDAFDVIHRTVAENHYNIVAQPPVFRPFSVQAKQIHLTSFNYETEGKKPHFCKLIKALPSFLRIESSLNQFTFHSAVVLSTTHHQSECK